MKHELKIVWVFAALLLVVTAIALVLLKDAEAETAPPEPLTVVGDLRLSDAPVDLCVAACVRVDALFDPAGHLSQGDALSVPSGQLSQRESQGIWADLTLLYVPPSIAAVILFDGWHMIHGAWEQVGENTLRLRFDLGDIAKLDGTVGVYLVILAEGD